MLPFILSLVVLCTCSVYGSEQALTYNMLSSKIRTQILSYVVADRLPTITVGLESRLSQTAPLKLADLACVNTTFARDIQSLRNDTRLNEELVARLVASLRAFTGESAYRPYKPAETVFDHWSPSDIDSIACRFERKFYSDDRTLAQFAQALLGDRRALNAVAQEYVAATARLLAPLYKRVCHNLKKNYDRFGCAEYEIQRQANPKFLERPYSNKVSEFSYYSCSLMESLAFIGLRGAFESEEGVRKSAYDRYVHDADFQRFYDTRLLLFLTLPSYAQRYDTDKQTAEIAARGSRFFTTLTRLIAQAHAQKQ